MALKRRPGKVLHTPHGGGTAMNTTTSFSVPALYRSEAFVEDLDLMPEPFEVQPGSTRARVQRLAAWLLAVPGTVAVLASAVVIATLPG